MTAALGVRRTKGCIPSFEASIEVMNREFEPFFERGCIDHLNPH